MVINLDNTYKAVSSKGEEAELSLATLLSFGEKTLLFFYPRDNTPGCTVENKDFSCLIEEFAKLNITLIGVSKDSIDSHKSFIEKQSLAVDLISDPDLILHKELGAFGKKNSYGKMVEGVIRSTFLLNKDGDIVKEWKNIRAKGHAQRVLDELKG